MTTEQMALVKKLIQKHEIEATDAEWTLIFMGVGYGLSEQQIDSYLVMNTTDLLAKHEKMLCILLGMDSETQGATNEIQNPAERIQFMLENHFQRKKPESGYESVMQYVIEDSDLSAAQIEQLRKRSMADRGVERQAMLRHNKRGSWLELSIQKMNAISRVDHAEMEGKLSSLKYECNGRLHKAEIRGNKVNIPLEACRFIQNSRGIIKGRVAITVTCSVGCVHMPESTALLIFWL